MIVSLHAQYQDPDTGADTWIVINCIIYDVLKVVNGV